MSDLETQTYKNPQTPQMSEKRRDVEQTARAEDRDNARHNRHGHTHSRAIRTLEHGPVAGTQV